MKKVKAILVLVVLAFLLTVLPQPVLAASNPYPSSQTIGGVTTIPCTFYAWQQAYERLGVVLSAWGNAVNWYDRALEAGYSVGTIPAANSIAVWSSSAHSYGHVAFVTNVDGDTMTVNEGGRSDKVDNKGIVNGQVLPSTVGTTWYNRTLLGFIYLDYKSVELYNYHPGNYHTVTEDNAILYGTVHKPPAECAEKFGIRVRLTTGTYTDGWAYYHLPSSSHLGTINITLSYDLRDEAGIPLKHATSYTCQFYAKINGKEYWSEEKTFTTTGSHSFDKGNVTKIPTCKETGIKTYTCTVCGDSYTEEIAKLTTHSYDNGVETKAPTCEEAGIKTYTCTVCGDSYTEEIAKLTEHSYENGTCTVCGSSDPDYVPPTEPAEPTTTEPVPDDPTEPAIDSIEPEDQEEAGGFFAAIAAFFETIFRILFWFMYL